MYSIFDAAKPVATAFVHTALPQKSIFAAQPQYKNRTRMHLDTTLIFFLDLISHHLDEIKFRNSEKIPPKCAA